MGDSDKKKDIYFIEWMCKNADGIYFLYGKAPFEKLMSTVICEGHQYLIKEKTFKDIIYHVLIQRAFWGCGEIRSMHMSNNGHYCFQFHTHTCSINNALDTSEECMESALKYKYDQES